MKRHVYECWMKDWTGLRFVVRVELTVENTSFRPEARDPMPVTEPRAIIAKTREYSTRSWPQSSLSRLRIRLTAVRIVCIARLLKDRACSKCVIGATRKQSTVCNWRGISSNWFEVHESVRSVETGLVFGDGLDPSGDA